MQTRCIDAAREAARLAARGDDDEAAQAAQKIAPQGAKLDLRREGGFVVASVAAHSILLPSITIQAGQQSISIEADLETGVMSIARQVIKFVGIDLTADQCREMTSSRSLDPAQDGRHYEFLEFITCSTTFRPVSPLRSTCRR